MRRALLIAGGTVGGLGAVLIVAPANSLSNLYSSSQFSSIPASANLVHSTATPTATSTPTRTHRKKAKIRRASLTHNISGKFDGPVVNVNYGDVQVQITVVGGKITDARALQAPSGRSDRYTQYALPILRQQTLAAQSSNIQGASGASYTSYGWYTSLQAALHKAGL